VREIEDANACERLSQRCFSKLLELQLGSAHDRRVSVTIGANALGERLR
jgi:hypothetical protein